MVINQELIDLLQCPSCKSGLKYNLEKENLKCKRCGIEYPVENDIPVVVTKE